MEVKKLGIANAKMVVLAVASLATVTAEIFNGGKSMVGEFMEIVDLTKSLGHISGIDLKAVIPEISDLDDAEKEELLLLFDANFKLPDGSAEHKIEAGMSALSEAVKAITFIINLVKV